MTRAISSVEGVQKVDVSFEKKEAMVTTATCSDKLDADIAAALKEAGYGGDIVNKTPTS